MNLSCLLDGHQATYADVRNQGLRFSQCRLCGCDLIRMRGGWKPAPKDFRVVWRPADAPAPEPVPLRLVRNLPVPSRSHFRGQVGRLGHYMRRSAAIAGADLKAGWGALVRFGLALRLPRRPRQLLLPLPLPARAPPGTRAFHIIVSPIEDLSSFAEAINRAAIKRPAISMPKPAPRARADQTDAPALINPALDPLLMTKCRDVVEPRNLARWVSVE